MFRTQPDPRDLLLGDHSRELRSELLPGGNVTECVASGPTMQEVVHDKRAPTENFQGLPSGQIDPKRALEASLFHRFWQGSATAGEAVS